MTERASDLLGALSDRLTADMGDTGASTADVVREAVPELVMAQPEGFTEMPIRSSAQFLEALFRSLRIDSTVPWPEYFVLAREASRRYAEKGLPLESLMQAMAIFRRANRRKCNRLSLPVAASQLSRQHTPASSRSRGAATRRPASSKTRRS